MHRKRGCPSALLLLLLSTAGWASESPARQWHYLMRVEATTLAFLPRAEVGGGRGFMQVESTFILDGGPEFGFNLGAPVRFRMWGGEGGAVVRREDWDSPSDWGQLIRGFLLGSDNAPVEWRDGAFRAHGFELGRFYDGRTGVYRLLDDELRETDGRPLAEVYDDADYVGRTLDGAESAVVKLALSIGYFLTYPLDSIAALKNLPAGMAALLESSPEYFERFRYMTRGEQIEAVAELTANLLVATGTAAATTRTVTGALAGAEATVPVLSLSVEGALALERVAVPVGRAASVLGGGAGAAIILHRANANAGPSSPSEGNGPGAWGPSDEKGASERARAYQEQISGRSYEEAYWVGGVGRKSGGTRFDGFERGVLLEAKGPGYAEFFEKNLAPKSWYVASGKAQELIDQALRQTKRVEGKGIRIEWHVAEKHAADAIRRMMDGQANITIVVIHTPPRLLVP